MKMTTLFALGLFVTCFHIDCKGQTDTAIYNKLMALDFSVYKNKPVKSFFKDLGYDYRKYIPASKKTGYIHRIIFRYTDSISVDIAVKDLGQKEPLDFNYKFNIDEFKEKKINWICFRYGGRCIKGCEYEYCD